MINVEYYKAVLFSIVSCPATAFLFGVLYFRSGTPNFFVVFAVLLIFHYAYIKTMTYSFKNGLNEMESE